MHKKNNSIPQVIRNKYDLGLRFFFFVKYKIINMKEIEIFAFTFVAIISMIMLSNSTNHQICLLVGVLGFIMFVIYKKCRSSHTYNRLSETEFDELIENGPTCEDSLLTQENTEPEPFIGPLLPEKPKFKVLFEVRPDPPATEGTKEVESKETPVPVSVSEDKITTGTDSVDCLCNFDGDLDDYGKIGDIDDIYADYARRKFVHTKEKSPDRSLMKKIFEPEVNVAEKRVWWEDVDNATT